MAHTDEELLKIVGEERRRSLGFGEGDSGELSARRQAGLAYARGDMINVPSAHQVPAPEGRSAVTDSTVADAVETLLPDVLEVFVGGDDIATFIANGEQDEESAQDETDYVTHVIFVENEGFLTLSAAIKDALLSITGIIHWWVEEEETDEPLGPPMPPEEVETALSSAKGNPDTKDWKIESEELEDGTVQLSHHEKRLKVCIKAVPSEDFTVASDTVSLRETHYCAMRTRVRVQELIARGVDPEKARELPAYAQRNDTVEQARDQAGEHNTPQDGGQGDLRIVEARAHYVRLLDEDSKELCIHRVLTDSEETIFLESEEVDHIPFAGGSPYLIPHRFYGEGVPDKAIEIQKIKTVLLRSHLDSIYFGLNQRNQVSEAEASENTIADLMRNAPGVPIRSKTGTAIKPVEGTPLNVDMLASLEYASTMTESRTGIVRNAQGLNPDTLHKAADTSMMLIGAAQKRPRLIARNFAETLVKDLFLGVHRTLRTSTTADHKPATAKIRNQWKTVQPHTWPERKAMAIHVGVGSAGKEHDLVISSKRLELMEATAAQGGLGTVLDPKNLYNGLMAFERAAGTKGGEKYWSDPAQMPPQQPKPDPEMEKAQAQIETERMKAGAQAQLAREKAAADLQTQREQLAAQAAAEREAAVNAHTLKMIQLREELDMEREKLSIQLENQREIELIKARNHHDIGMAKVNASVSQVEAGGEPG